MPAPDRAFGGNPHLAEAIFRLARAAQQGRSLKEEFRLPPPGEGEDERPASRPRWFRISVQPMPPDPRSGRKGALDVWQVDEITRTARARRRASPRCRRPSPISTTRRPASSPPTPTARIEYLNATLAQWLGLDLSEVAGRPLKLGQIMSEDNAALIASDRPRRGSGRRPAISTSTFSRPTAPRCRCASCIACRAAIELAHALVLNRGPGEARGGRRRRAPLRAAVPLRAHCHRHGRRAMGWSAPPMPPSSRMFGADADAGGGKAKLESFVDEADHQALRQALDAAIAGQG